MTNKDKDLLIKNIMELVQKNGGALGNFSKTASVTEVGNISDEEINKQFDQVFYGPNGLQKVAYAMQAPLKILLDYHGIGRRLLKIDSIPQGEIPVYDKDIDEFASVKVANLGRPPVVETSVKRILFPTMNLMRLAKVSYEDIEVRRYPVFDRAKERVAIAMAIAEDREIFNLLGVAANVGPNPQILLSSLGGKLGRVAFAKAFGVIAGRQLQPAQVVMSPARYADLLALGPDEIDQATLNQTTQTGSLGVFMGLQLLVSTKLPDPTKIYVTTTPDKLGRIPLRKELQVKINDFPIYGAYYVLGWELIGFGIHNTYGIVEIAQ